jgi:hypothetical protein
MGFFRNHLSMLFSADDFRSQEMANSNGLFRYVVWFLFPHDHLIAPELQFALHLHARLTYRCRQAARSSASLVATPFQKIGVWVFIGPSEICFFCREPSHRFSDSCLSA